MSVSFPLLLLLAVSGLGRLAVGTEAAGLPPPVSRPVDFRKDIQPLFEQHCLKCHGPEKQKSGWRADVKITALTGGDNYAPNILPGKSAESPLIRFVAGLEKDMTMPQKGDPLSAEQIGVLRAWIDQGAVWPEEGQATDPRKTHWAFQPLTRPSVPSVPGAPGKTPVDAFIRARLATEGLELSPEADRRTLIRRLTFDLTGLPPTPEEIEAFVSDASADAWEKLVERLLASPRYGERWARHWLDVVRFAESNGFEMNRARPNAWPYRDYVIRAFNEDKPYDRFLREQIAGDALGADEATGFLVGGPWDQVKSPDPALTAQQRADELHDMVSTTGSAFLGLTLGCARCHHHKFDPISQEDYYAVTAVLQGVQHGERPVRPPDSRERLAQAELLRGQLAPIVAQLAAFQPKAGAGRVLLLDDSAPPSTGAKPGVTQIEQPKNGQPIAYSAGTERGQAGDPGDVARLPNLGESYRYWEPKPGKSEPLFSWDPKLTGRFRIWLSWGVFTSHATDARYVLGGTQDQVEIARVNQRTFADGSAAIPGQKRWSGFFDAGVHELRPESRLLLCGSEAGEPTVADVVLFEEVADDAPARGTPHCRLPVSHGANEEIFDPVEAKFVRFAITASSTAQPCLDELEIFTDEPMPRNVALASAGATATASSVFAEGKNPKHQLAHLIDGRYGNSYSWISNEAGAGWVQIALPKPERIRRVVWSRDRGAEPPIYEDRLPTNYRIEVSLDGNSWRTVASSADRLGVEYRKRVTTLPALSDVPPAQAMEVQKLVETRARLEADIQRLTNFPPRYIGKFEAPGPTFRLHRGDPLQPKEQITPAGLSAFGGGLGLASDCPEQQRRLAFADWVASAKNPLTARVLVNRIWHYHFGVGLVETPSDFGLNGARPSHPELLDWLASELIARGWSIKEMQRLIVNSATYRQSGRPHPKARQVDAGSRLLWRYPPHRLEAEALRDTILAVSGKLDLRMGGPGFDLFEPNDNYVKIYTSKKDFGPEEFRRMVYQNKPRVQLDDIFGAFDCPDAGQTAPRRNSSTTPLQALNLLNSAFALQQAHFFADRLREEAGPEPPAQIRRAFALAFGREPSGEEISASASLIQEHGLPVFCRALFNANEFITVF